MKDSSDTALFPEPATLRTAWLGWVEPVVHWYTEVTRGEAAVGRSNINAWYAQFNDPNGTVAARLRSEVDVLHKQALDELFVHHLLGRRSTDLRYEEGGLGPDFRIYRDGECEAGVEVLSLFLQAEADERRHDRLAAELDQRVSPTAGYVVAFEIEIAPQDPAPSSFAAWVRTQLDQLPPPEQSSSPVASDPPNGIYEANGVRIQAWFIPVPDCDAPSRTDPDARIVATGALVGRVVTTGHRLRERIGSKAGGRYDIGDAPFLVAAVVHDAYSSDDLIIEALYGGESVLVATGELVRRNDGLFGRDEKRPEGRHRRVSAVAVIRNLTPCRPADIDVAVLHNPFAARPWPRHLLPHGREFGPVRERPEGTEFGWSPADQS